MSTPEPQARRPRASSRRMAALRSDSQEGAAAEKPRPLAEGDARAVITPRGYPLQF